MATFNATSGVEVVINVASWKEAKLLKMALEKELSQVGELTPASILLIDSSAAVDAVLWPCLARCLYDGQKITEQTFDKKEARADYYDVVTACIKENLDPLAEGLRLKLIEFGMVKTQAKTENTPKSE